MRPHEEHRSEAPARLAFEVVTVSSSRYEMKKQGKSFVDEGGDAAVAEIQEAGHSVSGRRLVSDDRGMIGKEVKNFVSEKSDVLVLTGGTGVAKTDVTIESVRPFFEKELDGFGELIRRVGYGQIGSAAMLTRATAGLVRGKLIICLPGSPDAVRTALQCTISEIPHAVYIARR